jgi:hypothetical protein
MTTRSELVDIAFDELKAMHKTDEDAELDAEEIVSYVLTNRSVVESYFHGVTDLIDLVRKAVEYQWGIKDRR